MFGLLQFGYYRADGIRQAFQPFFGSNTGGGGRIGSGKPYRTGEVSQDGGVQPCQNNRGICSRLYLELGMELQLVGLYGFHLTGKELAQVSVSVVQTFDFVAHLLSVLFLKRGKQYSDGIAAGLRVAHKVHVVYFWNMGQKQPAVILRGHGLGGIGFLRWKEAEASGNERASLFHAIVCKWKPQLVVQLHQGIICDVAHGDAGVVYIIVRPYPSGKTLHFFQRLCL